MQEQIGGGIFQKTDNYIVIQPRTDVELGTQYQITCHDQKGNQAHSTITVAQLQNDLDSDGFINVDEASKSITLFFASDRGIDDKTMLFFHLEAFMITQ